MKKKLFALVTVSLAAALVGCSKVGMGGNWSHMGTLDFVAPEGGICGEGNYQYGSVLEQGFHTAGDASYFSLDRNTAGYSLMRAQISNGMKIPADSVRAEELYNYFTYDYPAPAEGEGMKATAYLSECPWNEAHRLLTVGLKTEERVLENVRNNYVFLVDVSGSMSSRVWGLEDVTCLDLVKYGIETAVKGLGENDAVSIVTYASGTAVKLEPTRADGEGKAAIGRAVKSLVASGSTNGSGGIQLAYEQAERYYSKEGNNRVILLTDGDFNVGISNETQLKEFIQDKAASGVYLTVLGFGMGNMRDDFMQTLALNGNGNYAYIDTPREAEKALGKELNGMLTTVAKDAKAGVVFREDAVEEYRIIGYDMKIMNEDDFNNEEKDAGEIGSNLCVTALYELKLKENVEQGAEVAEVTVRYKSAETGENGEVKASAKNTLSNSRDVAFVSCVAEFALVLRASEYRASASAANVLARLNALSEYLEGDGDKAEFKELVQKAVALELYGA